MRDGQAHKRAPTRRKKLNQRRRKKEAEVLGKIRRFLEIDTPRVKRAEMKEHGK